MALVPAAPEAGLSLGLILLAIACLFLLALNKVWMFTIGALLRTMANMVNSLPHVSILGHKVPPWDALASGLGQIDNYVLEAIGTGIVQTEKGLHALLGAMAWVVQETADQVAGLAEDTVKVLHAFRQTLIPSLIAAAVIPIARELEHLGSRTKTIILHPTTAVTKTTQVIAPGFRALEGKVNALEARVAAIGAAAPAAVSQAVGAIPVTKPLAIPGDIYRGIDALWRDVKRIGKVVTPVGIVGLVAGAVLSTLRIPWLKCRNVDKAGRALCGINGNLLDSLITDALLITSTISIVELAKESQAFITDVEVPLKAFVRELRAVNPVKAPDASKALADFAAGSY